jgi:hypothetical protein
MRCCSKRRGNSPPMAPLAPNDAGWWRAAAGVQALDDFRAARAARKLSAIPDANSSVTGLSESAWLELEAEGKELAAPRSHVRCSDVVPCVRPTFPSRAFRSGGSLVGTQLDPLRTAARDAVAKAHSRQPSVGQTTPQEHSDKRLRNPPSHRSGRSPLVFPPSYRPDLNVGSISDQPSRGI